VEVNLSIKQHNDNVLCDVVPMETTHILLGGHDNLTPKPSMMVSPISFMNKNKEDYSQTLIS